MSLTEDQKKLLDLSRKIALQIGEAGREFTGTIGELATCHQFGYEWKPSVGYDAIDGNGRKIQIKSRKLWSSQKFKAGRINKFGRKNKYCFDIGVLVLLDNKFEITDAWELDWESIQRLELEEKSGRALHVSTFLKYATPKTMH